MGASQINDPEELDNLSCRSVMAINKYKVSAQDGALSLDAMLKLLEVRLMNLIKVRCYSSSRIVK